MLSNLFHSIGIPLGVALAAWLVLRFLEQIFYLSCRQRTQTLFGQSPWLPLRHSVDSIEGEQVTFLNSAGMTLRGTFISHQAQEKRGTVLFCHELNGSRQGIFPYVEQLTGSGFDILTFDFRDHGQSDSSPNRSRTGSSQRMSQPTPWTTAADLDDVNSAIRFLYSTERVNENDLSIFGLGKGANVALCIAGSDDRVRAVVLDTPMPEARLFHRNCRQVLIKSLQMSKRDMPVIISLFFKAILYTLTCPFIAAAMAWRRHVLGFWYSCRFIDPLPLAKNVQQPVMILHGHVDSVAKADQIRAFCERIPNRPRLWITPAHRRIANGYVSDNCRIQVARFLAETGSLNKAGIESDEWR